jgi:hypothetical protein
MAVGDTTLTGITWVPGEATGKNFAGVSVALPVNQDLNQAKGAGSGYKIARGLATLQGASPTFIAHGLSHAYAVTTTISGLSAPGVGTSVLTTTISGAYFNVYAWKPTTNANPTLIASTGTDGFFWTAVGD